MEIDVQSEGQSNFDMQSSISGSKYENNQEGETTIYGMFFCDSCKNMLMPAKANQGILEFQCNYCGKKQIDFSKRKDRQCMIYNKQLKAGSRKTVADKDFIFDASMPRLRIHCPECDHEESVYIVAPDNGERKIVVTLICANVDSEGFARCENVWQLPQDKAMLCKLDKKEKQMLKQFIREQRNANEDPNNRPLAKEFEQQLQNKKINKKEDKRNLQERLDALIDEQFQQSCDYYFPENEEMEMEDVDI